MINGLQQRKFFKRHDPRNFSYYKYGNLGTFDLSLLPKDGLGRKPTWIKDQRATDFCAAYASASVREDTEGIELNPLMTWAYAAYLRGDWKNWGMDLENMRKAVCKFGFIEEKDAPFKVEEKDRNFLAQIENYPKELKEKAAQHKAQSGFWIGYSPNFFDAIRIALWQNKNNDLTVLTGCDFKFSWLQKEKGIINDYNKKEQELGHAIKFYDWKQINGEDYLITQLSNGMIGDNGIMYFSRNIVNSSLFRFDGLMFIDENPNIVKKSQWSLISQILDKLEKILKLMFKQTEEIQKKIMDKNIEDAIIEEAIKTPEPKYNWDNPQNVRKSIRIICDEEGLTLKQKNEITETINCESGFKTNAVNKNTNGTSDYGIIQANSYWYIGKGKPIPSIEVALNDPTFCVRIMARAFKNGRAKDWICYRKLYG